MIISSASVPMCACLCVHVHVHCAMHTSIHTEQQNSSNTEQNRIENQPPWTLFFNFILYTFIRFAHSQSFSLHILCTCECIYVVNVYLFIYLFIIHKCTDIQNKCRNFSQIFLVLSLFPSFSSALSTHTHTSTLSARDVLLLPSFTVSHFQVPSFYTLHLLQIPPVPQTALVLVYTNSVAFYFLIQPPPPPPPTVRLPPLLS